MSPCNTTLEQLPQKWMTSFGVIMAGLSIMATLENGLVLITIYWYQIFHTKSNKILASLAMSDFLTGISVALLFTIQLFDENLRRNCTIDLIRRYLSTAFVGASVLTLGFISYDRSLHLTKLTAYHLSSRKLYLILVICWLIPLLVPLLRKVDDSEQVYSAFLVVMIVLILAVLIISYAILVKALYKQKSKRQIKLSSTNAKAERKAARTVIILVTCYFVCIMPICIHHLMNVIKQASDETLAKSYIIGMTFCIANSAVNPVIYLYRTPYLKSHLLRLIRCPVLINRKKASTSQEVNDVQLSDSTS